MNKTQLFTYVQEIVRDAQSLKDRHTDQISAPVNYACIFCQNDNEYADLAQLVSDFGTIRQETPTGPVFEIPPLSTSAGDVRLLKIRKPDVNRPERGDADFTAQDYVTFKSGYLGKPGFKLIRREAFEMIELVETGAEVLAYFSHPPLDEQLGITSSG